MRENDKWVCPHGVTYTGTADFIGGARNAHDELARAAEPDKYALNAAVVALRAMNIKAVSGFRVAEVEPVARMVIEAYLAAANRADPVGDEGTS